MFYLTFEYQMVRRPWHTGSGDKLTRKTKICQFHGEENAHSFLAAETRFYRLETALANKLEHLLTLHSGIVAEMNFQKNRDLL